MNYKEWKTEVERLLDELRGIDVGYPLGDNVVKPPAASTDSIAIRLNGIDPACAVKLDAFYGVCDGVSWPDVHNGYFIKEKLELGQVKNEYDPIEIIGNIEGPIIVVGSSGAGTLFAVRTQTGEVVLLPSGRTKANTYFDSKGKAWIVSSDFDGFARLLLEDLRAFIANTQGHAYVA